MRRADRLATRRPGTPVVVAGIAGAAFLVLPLVALVVRAPWPELGPLLLGDVVGRALFLSFSTAVAATVCAVVLGVPLARLLIAADAWPAPVRRLLRALVTVPMVLPPVVGGIALLLLLGRRGLLGEPLAVLGVQIPFTPVAVVLAQTFVAMPFLVLAVEGALRQVDPRLAQAAAALGAAPSRVFLRVELPLALPGLAAGAVLCFSRALGEFGATITFAGSLPGVTQTLPVAAYLQLQTDPDGAIAIALVLVAVSIGVLVLLRDRWLRQVR